MVIDHLIIRGGHFYLGELTSKLGGTGAHDSHEASDIDDTTTGLQSFLEIGLIVTHGKYGVLATIPNTFDIDVHCEIPGIGLFVTNGIEVLNLESQYLPYSFFCVESSIIIRMHDS